MWRTTSPWLGRFSHTDVNLTPGARPAKCDFLNGDSSNNNVAVADSPLQTATMWILPLVGYLGMALGFGFLTLAIASGLYYLSEIVEEHTVLAKKLLTRLIYAIIAIQLLLLIDGFPLKVVLLGVASHIVYLGNMRRFPVVKLSDPLFIFSCALVLLNHYICFVHFSALPRPIPGRYNYTAPLPSFAEIASYFGICVWLVPFALFVSLSASDNVLPTMGSEGPRDGTQGEGRKGGSLIKKVVDGFRQRVGEGGEGLGWWKRREERYL